MPQNQKITGRFKPGQSGNPGGRPKGLTDKITRIKEAIADTFSAADFAAWAKDKKNQTDYYNLMIKIMPKELQLDTPPGRFILICDDNTIVEKEDDDDSDKGKRAR